MPASRVNGLLDTQAIEHALVAAPAPADPHGQLEMHLGAELALELLARRGADRADHVAALADEDALLGLRLDPHVGADDEQVAGALLELVDEDLDRVRNLLEG